MYKLYWYNEETGKEHIEYGFAKHIVKRVSLLLSTRCIEVEYIFPVPFSFRALKNCMKHRSFERKD